MSGYGKHSSSTVNSQKPRDTQTLNSKSESVSFTADYKAAKDRTETKGGVTDPSPWDIISNFTVSE